MDKSERQRMRELCARRSQGEWYLNGDRIGAKDYLIGEVRSFAPADILYSVAACNAVPALLDALDAAEAEIERLRGELGKNTITRVFTR